MSDQLTTPPARRLNVIAVAMMTSLGLAVMAGAALLVMARVPTQAKVQRGPQSAQGQELRFQLPEFTLTERSGEPVGLADLKGKVWVASFVFARCTGPCPSVTRTMVRLQSELDLAGQENLRLVTFTVDPERDNPDELKKYASVYNAHPERWLFLTGSEPEIHTLLNRSFKVQAGPSQNPHPPAGQEFDHSTRLAVVDQAGAIRGYFDGYRGPNDPDDAAYENSLARLKALVQALLRDGA